jgi:hypothetical protein
VFGVLRGTRAEPRTLEEEEEEEDSYSMILENNILLQHLFYVRKMLF